MTRPATPGLCTEHAIALTHQAVALMPGPHRAKRIAAMLKCSYRSVQDWLSGRRSMSLDAIIEFAAANPEFHTALNIRIVAVRAAKATART